MLSFIVFPAKAILATMNEDQHSAIMKVLHNEDYTLIMGMPGTGKDGCRLL